MLRYEWIFVGDKLIFSSSLSNPDPKSFGTYHPIQMLSFEELLMQY